MVTNYDNPIMIGGCGSSGTTLLGHLLNSHPTIICVFELYLLNKKLLYNDFSFSEESFRNILKKRIPSTNILSHDFMSSSTYKRVIRSSTFFQNYQEYGFVEEELYSLAGQSRDFREFIDKFFQKILVDNSKTRWAEKTPGNCYCIGEFLTIYPSGKYIHIVRDGRDVVVSLVKRGSSPEAAVRRWMYDTALGLAHRNNSRYYEIRYEDLVADTEHTLAKLLSFLGEDEKDARSLLKQANKSEVLQVVHNTWNLKPNDTISSNLVDKWKRDDLIDKLYFERLFRYTVFSKEVSKRLGISKRCNANDILLKFNYSLDEYWNPNIILDWNIISDYFRERKFEFRNDKKLLTRVSFY